MEKKHDQPHWKDLNALLQKTVDNYLKSNSTPLVIFLKPCYDEAELFRQNCLRYSFTSREIEIASLTEKGYSYKAIAGALHISPKTVGRHLANMYEKLEVRNRIELIKKLKNI